MLSDTGFFCRNVLGMNTDRDPYTSVISQEGEGGIRASGPHQQATEFMDEQHADRPAGTPMTRDIQYRVLAMPRFTYKSSRALGLICRLILRHKNISIMSCMASKRDAEERVLKVREILETNPIIQELFGDPVGKPWKSDQFVTAWREDKTILSPTLFAASPQTGIAGHRPDFVLLDDVSNEKTCTDLQKAKVVRFIESAIATQGRTTKFLMICTPWYEGDGFSWAQKANWKMLAHLDAGVDIVRGEDGMPDLALPPGKTETRWPNLPIEFLRRQLHGGVTPEFFTSQFLLRTVNSVDPHFQATQFQPVAWHESFSRLSGYLLCDVAPSGSPSGDQNVLMYVGLDERFLYILDCEVGYWKQSEFCERYVNMLARWQGRVRHRGDVWEKGQCYYAYTESIKTLATQRHVRFEVLHADQRNSTSKSKEARILGLPVRFQTQRVRVCTTTVPRTWNTGTRVECLFDAEGETDVRTRMKIPAGEMVDQFVRFPGHPKKDIPDCLSLIDAMDEKANRRVCFFVPPEASTLPQEVMRTAEADEQFLKMGSAQRFFAKFSKRSR
jgi:hypothetical protein